MFVTKLLITVIYLIVATIVHHGYAAKPEYQQRCENLIEGFWFKSGENDGENNFQIAFFDLTVIQMDIYLNQWYQEVIPHYPNQGPTLQVQAELLKDYYKSLFSKHGLTSYDFYQKLETICGWCINKIAEMASRSGKKDSVKNCEKAIKDKFKIGYESYEGIYKKLYEEFTLNDLRTARNLDCPSTPITPSRRIDTENTEELLNTDRNLAGPSTPIILSRRIDTENIVELVDNYPYHFFRYYEETIRTHGKFKHLGMFCSGLSQSMKEKLLALPNAI